VSEPDPILAAFDDIAVPGKRPRREVVKPAEVVTEAWDVKPVWKFLKGQATEFFTIGHLAASLNRRPVTIRSWEDKKILPVSRYRAPAPKGEQVPGKKTMGKRLYTRAQIEVVIKAAAQTGVLANSKDADWRTFTKLVVHGWKHAD